METRNEATDVSRASRWAAGTISVVVVTFLAFDSAVKVLKLAPAIEGTVRIGFPERLVRGLGLVELACLVLYVIPRTSVLGAILLTGFLGGATAAQARLENPWLVFSVVFGVLVWGAIFLRDQRVRALIPLREGDANPQFLPED